MRDQSRKLSESELFHAYSRTNPSERHDYLGQRTAGPVNSATGQHTDHFEYERCKVCWEYDLYDAPQLPQHLEEP